MDNTILILLALTEEPMWLEDLMNKIGHELEDDSPWGCPINANDFVNDLQKLLGTDYATDNEAGQYSLSMSGLKELKANRAIQFILTQAGLKQLA